MQSMIAISLGAIGGALSRYYLSLWFNQLLGNTFPFGTGIINLTGCFGMGFFTTLAPARSIHPNLRLLTTTGFLGSYTTFSTYQLDTVKLLAQGSWEIDLLYWVGSAGLGLLALSLGMVTAKWFTFSE
jgi:fluoride exporter